MILDWLSSLGGERAEFVKTLDRWRNIYHGSAAWERYYEAMWAMHSHYYPDADPNLYKLLRLELGTIDKTTARVIIYHTGSVHYANEWLQGRIPALDHYKPSDILKEHDGEKVIRAVLMRWP